MKFASFSEDMETKFLSNSVQSIKKCFSSSKQFPLQTKQSLSPSGIEAPLGFLYLHISLFVYVKYELPIAVLVILGFYELDF